jgi:type I restriction enzyme S subunit
MRQSPPSSTYNNKREGLPFLQGKAEFGEIHPSPTVYCSKPIKIAKKTIFFLQ